MSKTRETAVDTNSRNRTQQGSVTLTRTQERHECRRFRVDRSRVRVVSSSGVNRHVLPPRVRFSVSGVNIRHCLQPIANDLVLTLDKAWKRAPQPRVKAGRSGESKTTEQERTLRARIVRTTVTRLDAVLLAERRHRLVAELAAIVGVKNMNLPTLDVLGLTPMFKEGNDSLHGLVLRSVRPHELCEVILQNKNLSAVPATEATGQEENTLP